MCPSFLHALAQARPDPGGGAAAAHGARLALALLEKVAQLELQRPRPAGAEQSPWAEWLAKARQAAGEFARLQEEDVQAYFHLSRARAGANPVKLRAAVQEAIACPQRMMQYAQQALALTAMIGAECRPHLVSDLLVAVELLVAALNGAYHIAGANLPLLPDDGMRQALARGLAGEAETGRTLARQVAAALLARSGPAAHE